MIRKSGHRFSEKIMRKRIEGIMSVQAQTSRRIDVLLAEYGESHQNPTNKLIHWFAVPTIAWTVLALLWEAPTPAAFAAIPYLNWATIACALAVLYYLTLSIPLALGMIVYSAVALWLIVLVKAATGVPLVWIALAIFVVAWIFQFKGHQIEGKKPSFFKDVQFLLIGPAWLMHFLFRRLGIPY
jgi:uncharacterized membrane protein YGL010W